jgi:hypothetical protein
MSEKDEMSTRRDVSEGDQCQMQKVLRVEVLDWAAAVPFHTPPCAW